MSDATKELVRMVSTWYELLAACEALVVWADQGPDAPGDSWVYLTESIALAREAIRKAKGGS